MAKRPSFNELQALGFFLHVPGGVPPRGWIDRKEIDVLAHDARTRPFPLNCSPITTRA